MLESDCPAQRVFEAPWHIYANWVLIINEHFGYFVQASICYLQEAVIRLMQLDRYKSFHIPWEMTLCVQNRVVIFFMMEIKLA